MAAVTICSDFGAWENKIYHCFHIFPSISHEVMGPGTRILIFLVSSQLFHSPLSPSSTGSLVPLHFLPWVVLSIHLRLFMFLPEILILACDSSSLVSCIMYSAYKLNKQDDNIQPWWTPFHNWNQSVVPCPFLFFFFFLISFFFHFYQLFYFFIFFIFF